VYEHFGSEVTDTTSLPRFPLTPQYRTFFIMSSNFGTDFEHIFNMFLVPF